MQASNVCSGIGITFSDNGGGASNHWVDPRKRKQFGIRESSVFSGTYVTQLHTNSLSTLDSYLLSRSIPYHRYVVNKKSAIAIPIESISALGMKGTPNVGHPF